MPKITKPAPKKVTPAPKKRRPKPKSASDDGLPFQYVQRGHWKPKQ